MKSTKSAIIVDEGVINMKQYHLADSRINAVTKEVINTAIDTLGERLDKVILFGSYARGDFNSDSDVDIFVLANVPQEETNRWSNIIDDCLPDFLYDNSLLVCIHLTSKELFDRYYHVLPYYQNVIREGIELHG